MTMKDKTDECISGVDVFRRVFAASGHKPPTFSIKMLVLRGLFRLNLPMMETNEINLLDTTECETKRICYKPKLLVVQQLSYVIDCVGNI
jgi:hypothetical protein